VIIWIDAQLPPAIAAWVSENFTVSARAATDRAIFLAAKAASAVVPPSL
jgi:predicted nuclease of predicted toxin-antitoxin system